MRPVRPWFSRKAFAMSAVAALGVSVLAACTSTSSSSGSPTPSGSSLGTLTIGASLSLTGDFSADGEAFEKGYQLWAKDVNAHGGLLGRKVKLTILNDDSSPSQVVTNYQTAARRGPCGPDLRAVLLAAHRAGIVGRRAVRHGVRGRGRRRAGRLRHAVQPG